VFCSCLVVAGQTAGRPAQPAIAREGRIPVAGAELYVRAIGTGTPVIVLHGGPDFDQSYLLPEMDRLADRFHLIYYDQRGRGKSSNGVRPEDVTLASDIADIDKVRQHFHLDSVVLLGHSWGTVLALEYATRYPERVSRLILMNPAPASANDYRQLRNDWLEKRPDDMRQRKGIAESAAYKEGDPDAVTAYYRIHFKPALAKPEDYDKLIARMRASFTPAGVLKARAIEARLDQETWLSPDYDLLPKLKQLQTPALVIYGDHDFIPASTAEHIAQALPHAHLVTLSNCGHFTYLECPSAVREQIDAFWDQKTASADHSAEEEIKALEEERNRAILNGDAAALERMTADDYTFITLRGELRTKAEIVKGFQSGSFKYDSRTISDLNVRIYGDTAIVTGRSMQKGIENGKDYSGDYRFTRVYVKQGGHWITVALQTTPIRP
jgi:proline iminopeptidase